MSELRIAVVGAGIMGSNHVRVARLHHDARLAAVVDADADRARAAVGDSGADAFSSVSELAGRVDAVVLAAPTPSHLTVGTEVLEMGLHLLVEKPIASTAEQARQLVGVAERVGKTLMVGHIERFNPAVAQLKDYVTAPVHIEASRINPYTPRIGDGVVLDLMIHDLDIVLSLLPDDVAATSVAGIAQTIKGATEDLAVVSVQFSNGVTAVFNTSRLGQTKIRSIEVTQDDAMVTADLLRQGIEIHRMSHHEYVGEEGARYRQSSVVEIPFIDGRGEPLFHEQRDFIDSIRNGSSPRVTGADGLRALELAERALAAVAGVQ